MPSTRERDNNRRRNIHSKNLFLLETRKAATVRHPAETGLWLAQEPSLTHTPFQPGPGRGISFCKDSNVLFETASDVLEFLRHFRKRSDGTDREPVAAHVCPQFQRPVDRLGPQESPTRSPLVSNRQYIMLKIIDVLHFRSCLCACSPRLQLALLSKPMKILATDPKKGQCGKNSQIFKSNWDS